MSQQDKATSPKLSSKQKYDFIWNCMFAILLIPTAIGFGQAIYTLYFYATWELGFTLDFLFLFLTFLYLMHINWCVLLLSKFYLILVGNRLSDTVEFKKKSKQVKNK